IATNDLCNKTFGVDEYRWIQEEIKETGDGSVLHGELMYSNTTVYQQYLSLVNGNQQVVEKFLREKLASDAFDKLHSTLKKVADNVGYMFVQAKRASNEAREQLDVDRHCYQFLMGLLRKELHGEDDINRDYAWLSNSEKSYGRWSGQCHAKARSAGKGISDNELGA
ncbi:MAG: hypothetical protein J3Q66DRAFT_359036, partial [Benniella sp.]